MDLLQYFMPIVNNIYSILKNCVKQVDLILSVLTTTIKNRKGKEKDTTFIFFLLWNK